MTPVPEKKGPWRQRTYFGYRLPCYDKRYRCPVRAGSALDRPTDYEKSLVGTFRSLLGSGQKVVPYWLCRLDYQTWQLWRLKYRRYDFKDWLGL